MHKMEITGCQQIRPALMPGMALLLRKRTETEILAMMTEVFLMGLVLRRYLFQVLQVVLLLSLLLKALALQWMWEHMSGRAIP